MGNLRCSRANLFARLVLIAALLAACTAHPSATTSPQPTGGIPGVLRIVGAGSMDSMIPELSGNATSVDTGMFWGAWLFLVNDKGELEPELATRVPTVENGDITPTGRTITYHLRNGVRWHDGAPFDARDVIYTWHAIMNSANNVITREGYDDIDWMRAPDPYTLVVRLKHPYAPAVATFFGPSLAPMCILPAHLLENLPDINHAAYNNRPIGTGPFIVQSYDPSTGIVLKANPHYWRGPPKLKKIRYLIVPDPTTRAVMMRTGDADLFYDPPNNLLPELRTIPQLRLMHTVFNEFWYLGFNETHPPLDDVRLRRAIAQGIDKKFIIRAVMHGAAVPAEADEPAYYWAYDPTIKAPPYDPPAAAKLLDDAGWTIGQDGIRQKSGQRLSLQFVYTTGNADAVRFGPIFQSAMNKLGIEIQLKGYPTSLYYAAKQSGGIVNNAKFDIAYEGWIGGVDPDDATLWMCSRHPPNGYNTSFSCDPRIDEQEKIALQAYDRPTRKAAYFTLQHLLNQDLPAAFLYWTLRNDAVRAGFAGYRPAPTVTEFWNSWEWNIE